MRIMLSSALIALFAASQCSAAQESSFAKDNVRLEEASQRGSLSSELASRGDLAGAYAGAQDSLAVLQGAAFSPSTRVMPDLGDYEYEHKTSPNDLPRRLSNPIGGIGNGAAYGFLKTIGTVEWPAIQLGKACSRANENAEPRRGFLYGAAAFALGALLLLPAAALGLLGGVVGAVVGPIAELASPHCTKDILDKDPL